MISQLRLVPTLDTYIAEGGFADQNYGAETHVAIGNVFPLSLDVAYRGLCRFLIDPAVVPASAVIARARLVLNRGGGSLSQARTFTIAELGRDWLSAEVTWNRATASTTWTTPGGDLLAGGAVDMLVVNPADSVLTFDVTSLVSAAVKFRDGQANWRIRGAEATGAADWIDIRSSEYSVEDLRPALLIEYLVPQPPPSGPIAVPEWKLARMLAACASAQQRFGYNTGDVWALGQTLDRIVTPVAEGKELWPAILVNGGDQWQLERISGGSGNYLRPNGSCLLMLSDKSRYQGNIDAGLREFKIWIGALLKELASQAAVDDLLSIEGIRQELPPFLPSREESVSQEFDYFCASYFVDWK
jgi:hypothetical protein